jgi:hypothetical protein
VSPPDSAVPLLVLSQERPSFLLNCWFITNHSPLYANVMLLCPGEQINSGDLGGSI